MPEIDWDTLDYDDPCALYQALNKQYLRYIAGELDQEVEIDGRRVRFTPTSLAKFEHLLNRLKAECAAKTSGRRRRFAAVSRHLR